MDEITITGNKPGVIGRIIEMHGTYYDEHWNFGVRFEAMVAEILGEFVQRFDPAHDGIWAAWDGDTFVGGIVIDGHERDTKGARLRTFIIDPAYHGRGIGHRLMQEAVGFCDKAGFKRVWLTTVKGLEAAHHLYVAYGFKICHEVVDTSWGMEMTEQEWERSKSD